MRLFPLLLVLLLATSGFGADLEFVGLRSFPEDDLKEAIGGRLDYIRKRDATDYRADDAAYLVETFLRSHGLPDATVSGQAVTSDDIRLTIEEGLAQYLGPITVVGWKETEEVQEQFRAAFPEAATRRAFRADAIATGLARVRDLLHADGYWTASVGSSRAPRNAQSEIPFTLTIEPGPLFKLAPPRLETPVPASESLKVKLAAITGDTATAEAINSIRATISENYRQRGYSDLSLTMARELEGGRLRLLFSITPGRKYSVRSINPTGLKRTESRRIEERFDDLIGQTYDENQINERIKKLLSTGAFDSIRLDSTESGPNELDLTLDFSEAKARGYSFALGYGSIEGYVLGARYYDRNLWGRLWNLSAGAELTGLGGLGEVSLSNPFFLNKNLNLANRAYLVSRNFENYDKLQGGIGTELSWERGPHYSAALGLELSQTSVTSPIPDSLIGPTDYLVNRLNFRQIYDRRDDPALPSDGWYARLENSLGFASGDGGIGFFDTRARLGYYHSLGDQQTLALGLRGGLIVPTRNDDQLPLDLRRFLGGANTIRSFPELQMGPYFDDYSLGGTTWWVANAEYTRTLAGPVKGLLFFDAARLDTETDLAVGLGVRVNLPVGPIRLEYGRSLSRDPGEPSGAFHFAIGTTF